MLKKRLGKRIQELRKYKKITQEALAETIGIDSKSVSQIETGNAYPSAETLSSIAKALDVDFYELFIFNNDIPYDDMKNQIIKSLDDKKNILSLYRYLMGL